MALGAFDSNLFLGLLVKVDSKTMLFGGTPVGKRDIHRHVASSSEQRLVQAGSMGTRFFGDASGHFGPIPFDDKEFYSAARGISQESIGNYYVKV